MMEFNKLKRLHIKGLPVIWTVHPTGKESYKIEVSDAVAALTASIDREILRQLRRHAATF